MKTKKQLGSDAHIIMADEFHKDCRNVERFVRIFFPNFVYHTNLLEIITKLKFLSVNYSFKPTNEDKKKPISTIIFQILSPIHVIALSDI